MKTKKPKNNSKVTAVVQPEKPKKPKLDPPELRIKSSINMAPHKLAGPGFIVIRSKGSTKWERLKNLVRFAWDYIVHGRAKL